MDPFSPEYDAETHSTSPEGPSFDDLPVAVAVPMARPLAVGAGAVAYATPAPSASVAWAWIGLIGFCVCAALFVGSQVAGAVALIHTMGTESVFDWLGVIVVTGEVVTMAMLPMGIVLVSRGSMKRDLLLATPRTLLLIALAPLIVAWPITSQVMSEYLATFFPPDIEHLDLMGQLTQWDSASRAVVVIFQIAFVPAVCEEILFRGLLLSALRRLIGKWPAVLTVAVVFAAAHVVTLVFVSPLSALGMFIPLAFLGLGLTVLAAETGTLVYSSILHFANNLFALLMVNVLQVDAQREWLRNWVSLNCLAMSAVAFLAWWVLLARRQSGAPPAVPVPVADGQGASGF